MNYVALYRKNEAAILAVPERQSLETLKRDFKTSIRALEQLKDRVEQLNTKKTKLGEDETAQRARRVEVSWKHPSFYRDVI